MQGTKDLTKGAIGRLLFMLAMPILATSFIQLAYNLTDQLWVCRISSEAGAAVGAVSLLMWMSFSIHLLTKVGAEVSVGQSIGAKSVVDAKLFATHNITISLIISVLLASVLFVFAEPIIAIYKLEQHIANDAVEYMRIVVTALPFMFLTGVFTGIYNASGRSKIPFYISGSGLVMNMILDPLFIMGFDWGIKGAAYATWISQLTVFSIFVYKIKYKDTLLGGFSFIGKLHSKYSLKVLKIGVPVAMLNTLFAFVNIFITRSASEQGGHTGAMTFTTGGQIEGITWSSSGGFSTALSSFVAQNYAAGEIGRVKKAWYTTLMITSVFGALFTILFVFFGNEIFSVFVPNEPDVYEAGGVFLRIDGYSQLFMMLEITMQGMFYGMGRTMPPAIVSISCNVMRIPLSILLVSLGMGVEGIWWAVCISTIAKGLLLLTWFFITRKQYLTVKTVISD